MPAYFIAQVDIKDLEKFGEYAKATPPLIEKYGGKFLVRGGPMEKVEGDWDLPRVVVLEFPSVEVGKSFYNSPEYQEVRKLRLGGVAEVQSIIVDGGS